MRVALHLPFVLQQNTGITRYIFGLLRALAIAASDIEYHCFLPAQAQLPITLPDNFHRIALPKGGGGTGNPLSRILREGVTLARAYRAEPWDVLHAPHSYLPLWVPSATVLTLHDLRVLRYPQTFSRFRGAFLHWAIPQSVRRATLTIASSLETRREALALLRGAAPDRIRVSYPGLDEIWFAPIAPEQKQETQHRLGLPAFYLLTVGTWEPHKNLPRVLEAFERLKAQNGFADLHLLLVGATFATGKSDDLRTWLAGRSVAPFVHPLGIVSDADLRTVYAGAEALIFPSLYEGFGYPPLEAMASGIPVVTSRLSCLPEIVGDAAELVDPLDSADIARGMATVLDNGDRQAQLRGHGFEQARRYRWENHATEVIAAYQGSARLYKV